MPKLHLFAAASLAALLASQPAHAQKGPATNLKPYNELDPRDKKVLPYATGALETFRDWGWYQVLAYCAAVYSTHSYDLKRAGKAAEFEAMQREVDDRYHTPAITRVAADRAISVEAAVRIVDAELIPYSDYLSSTVSDFDAESTRCKAVATAYRNGGTPPVAKAAPATPKPVERMFKANTRLTSAYDGEPYWKLMIRCSMGWANGPGQAPQMAKQFTRSAGYLLQNEMKLDATAAEAKGRAAMASLAPIAPVDVRPETDPCLAISQQMVAEARTQ